MVSVELVGHEDVFDIEVDRTHNFVANGLVTHNTRWHEDDLNARVVKLEGDERDGGRWRVINLAALNEDPDDVLGRAVGDPLPHPWIDPDDHDAMLRHWQDKRLTSTLRDWFSLYQGDPKPVEGALLSEEQVTAATWNGDLPEAVKTGVAIDSSGGGRDEAGIVGGQLNADGIVIWTHDRSGRMGSAQWSREACLLAYEIQANEFIIEHNYGGDQGKLILRTTWEALKREGLIPETEVCPHVVEVHAKKGKRVRAEPIAAQVQLGKIKFWALNVLQVGSEWQTWQEDSKESPGRIDASCYLAYKWLKIPGSESFVSTIASDEMPKTGTGKGVLAQRRLARGR